MSASHLEMVILVGYILGNIYIYIYMGKTPAFVRYVKHPQKWRWTTVFDRGFSLVVYKRYCFLYPSGVAKPSTSPEGTKPPPNHSPVRLSQKVRLWPYLYVGQFPRTPYETMGFPHLFVPPWCQGTPLFAALPSTCQPPEPGTLQYSWPWLLGQNGASFPHGNFCEGKNDGTCSWTLCHHDWPWDLGVAMGRLFSNKAIWDQKKMGDGIFVWIGWIHLINTVRWCPILS